MFAHACPSARLRAERLIRAMALEIVDEKGIDSSKPFRFSDYEGGQEVYFYDQDGMYGVRQGDAILVVDDLAHIFAVGLPDRLGGESTCVYAGPVPDDPEALLREWAWEVEDRFERERFRLARQSVVSVTLNDVSGDTVVNKWFSSPDLIDGGIGAARMGDYALLTVGEGYHRQRFKIVVGPESLLLYRGDSHRPADEPYRWSLCWESLFFEECLEYVEHPESREGMNVALLDALLEDNRRYGEAMNFTSNSYLRISKGALNGTLEYPGQTIAVIDWAIVTEDGRRSFPSLFQILSSTE